MMNILYNFENTSFIKKYLENRQGNVSISRMTVLRVVMMIVMLFPVFILNDEYYLMRLAGSFIAPLLGIFIPVS